MTTPAPFRPPGLDEAMRALAQGRAAVVPNPSPMTYGVVATDPHVVNAVKGRPLEQEVAVSLHDRAEWHRVAGLLDVPRGVAARVEALLAQRVSVLAPLRVDVDVPAWLRPAVRHRTLAMFDPRWEPTEPLWTRFRRLYGSSAGRTGQPAAASAAQAVATFGPDVPVVDADALRDLTVAHSPSTMVRVDRDGALHLSRPGAQDPDLG